jgi:hypothetical protein
MADEMVIFTRAFDLLEWLLPRAEKFPAVQRFVLTRRLTNAAMDCIESLYHANSLQGAARYHQLQLADAHLNKLRFYLRLAHRFQWLSDGQYKHVSVMVSEIGRLLGGWIKQTGGGRA